MPPHLESQLGSNPTGTTCCSSSWKKGLFALANLVCPVQGDECLDLCAQSVRQATGMQCSTSSSFVNSSPTDLYHSSAFLPCRAPPVAGPAAQAVAQGRCAPMVSSLTQSPDSVTVMPRKTLCSQVSSQAMPTVALYGLGGRAAGRAVCGCLCGWPSASTTSSATLITLPSGGGYPSPDE